MISQKKPYRQEGAGKKYSNHEKQGPTSKITVSSKAIIQNGREDKVLPRQGKTKGVHHHQALII